MSTQDTNPKEYKKLKEKAKLLEPVIRIGKGGLTASVIEEIKKHLKKKGLVKVKMLGSFLEDKDKELAVKEVAEKTDSILVDTVGFVVVLLKKNDKNIYKRMN